MSRRPPRLSPAAFAAALALCLAGCPGKDHEACPTGQTRCSGTCVDLRTSFENCGACGNACLAGGSCAAGTCSCPAELPDACAEAGHACVDLRTGAGGFCGTCGLACAGTDVASIDAPCTAGSCVCAGTPTATDCGGNPRCVNTLTDESHCGVCGTACDVAKHWTCDAGTCRCVGTFGTQCGTACVNVTNDPTNCGSCGHVCPATATCTASQCVCPGTNTIACGTTCCGGTQCCGTGTQCQPEHSNGLGGTYLLGCTAPLSPSQTTHDAARAAADSWHSGPGTTTFDGSTQCGSFCLGRQTATQCAVWCWEGSASPGKVQLDSIGTECTCPTPA